MLFFKLVNCRFTLVLLQLAINAEPSVNQRQVLRLHRRIIKGGQKYLSITVSSTVLRAARKAIELDTMWRVLLGRYTATMTVVVYMDLVSMAYGFLSLSTQIMSNPTEPFTCPK